MASEREPLTRSRCESFNDLLMEAVGEVLNQVLGEAVVRIILQRLKIVNSSLEEDLEAEFISDALHRILGLGAVSLEALILRHLYSKFDLNLEFRNGYTFSDYVEELKKIWTRRLKE